MNTVKEKHTYLKINYIFFKRKKLWNKAIIENL